MRRRTISVWFPEAVVTPTSRVHFPPAHPHCSYRPAEQQTTSSNRSSPSHTLKAVQQPPDGRAETPTLGGLRSRTECAAAPAGDTSWVSSEESRQGGVGRKGESSGVLSCLSWDETEVCTHLLTGALEPRGSTSLDAANGNRGG